MPYGADTLDLACKAEKAGADLAVMASENEWHAPPTATPVLSHAAGSGVTAEAYGEQAATQPLLRMIWPPKEGQP